MVIHIDSRGTTVSCDGSFTAWANVRETTEPPRDVSVGVAEVDPTAGHFSRAPTADKNTLPSLSTVYQSVTITGQLKTPCQAGEFKLLVGAIPKTFRVEWGTVTAKLTGVPPEADKDGKFTYDLEVRCCVPAAAPAETWELPHQRSTNVLSSAPVPPSVTCPAAGPHTVTVTGQLRDKWTPGIDVYGLSLANNLQCRVEIDVKEYSEAASTDGCLTRVPRRLREMRARRKETEG